MSQKLSQKKNRPEFVVGRFFFCNLTPKNLKALISFDTLTQSYFKKGDSMLTFLFTGIVLIAICLTVSIFNIVLSGRACRSNNEGTIRNHKRWTNRFILLTILLVIFAETYVKIILQGTIYNLLFYIHLVFIGLFILSFSLARFWITGVYCRKFHKIIVYPCTIFFLGVLITGAMLLLKL